MFMLKKFPWQAKNERILFESREHILSYLWNKLSKIFIVVWLLFFIWILMYVFSIHSIIIFTTIGVFFVLILFLLYFFWYNTYFILTNKRILKFIRNWLFTEYIKDLKLDQLNELSSTKKWIIQKIFNIWNIKIVWKGEGNVIWYKWIYCPNEVVAYTSRLRDFIRENPNYDFKLLKEFKTRKERKN